MLALKNGDAASVKNLLDSGAPLAVVLEGKTPLELAVFRADISSASAMLSGSNSDLSYGLLKLQKQLAEASARLPRLLQRWPLGQQEVDGLETMRNLVPDAFRPKPNEREAVGENPSDWVLLYESRVMKALAVAPGDPLQVSGLAELLGQHGYDAFARDYTWTAVLLSCVFGCFGLMTYLAFRVRTFGWLEVPVSLSESIPGAYDPVRWTDPDFDPHRQETKLPYLVAKDFHAKQDDASGISLLAFGKALLGFFSAWLLQTVRIPPQKDQYDEAYDSDHDEDCRDKVRQVCADRAKAVRTGEVLTRLGLLVFLLWWLGLCTFRWLDMGLIVSLYLFHAWIAAAVASSTDPKPCPEKCPDDDQGFDSARSIHALFSVQLGPRWTRAIRTTRSTAAPRRRTVPRRRTRRSASSSRDGDRGGESSSGAEGMGDGAESGTDVASNADKSEGSPMADASPTAAGDKFQRDFLKSSVLHTSHKDFLELSCGTLVTTFVLMLWLLQIRRLLSPFVSFYQRLEPAELFEAYGRPGTADRGESIVLEVLLIALCTERLYEIAGLLHVATLTLKQRSASLAFFSEHRAPPLSISGEDQEEMVDEVTRHMEELTRCANFTLELSTVRWNVLREPVQSVYYATVALLWFTVAMLVLPMVPVQFNGFDFERIGQVLDPAVPMCVALSLLRPLSLVLLAGAASNKEVTLQREIVQQEAERALESIQVNKKVDDVHYVNVRVKSREVLNDAEICWLGGQPLTSVEPTYLAMLTSAAAGAALARGFLALV